MYAAVAELADARDSKSRGAIRAGSSPASGINKFDSLVFGRGVFSCSIQITRLEKTSPSNLHVSHVSAQKTGAKCS